MSVVSILWLTYCCCCCGGGVDLCAGDSEHGVTFSPMVDTDALNANIALLGLHLLQKHHPGAFPPLDFLSERTAIGLDARPPCRWEEQIYQVPELRKDSSSSTATALHTAGPYDATETRFQAEQRHKEEATATEEADHAREVEVVLDMGHNPAAMAALSRRIAYKFPDRDVRY